MKKVNCPQCKKEVVWSDKHSFKPFCSERCRLLDLGAWASERHRIPGSSIILDEEEILEREDEL